MDSAEQDESLNVVEIVVVLVLLAVASVATIGGLFAWLGDADPMAVATVCLLALGLALLLEVWLNISASVLDRLRDRQETRRDYL